MHLKFYFHFVSKFFEKEKVHPNEYENTCDCTARWFIIKYFLKTLSKLANIFFPYIINYLPRENHISVLLFGFYRNGIELDFNYLILSENYTCFIVCFQWFTSMFQNIWVKNVRGWQYKGTEFDPGWVMWKKNAEI